MRRIIALDLSVPDALRREKAADYDGLMAGSEFCARLLPEPAALKDALKNFSGELIIATPVLPQRDLEKTLRLVQACLRSGRKTEVVANDLGLLEALRCRFRGRVKVSCGRILSHRIKLMPRDYASRFLERYSISGFEIDDERIVRRLKPYGLPFSWHYPFRYATTTRFCPWEGRWSERCSHSCRDRLEPLQSVRVSRTLWLMGGAYFLRGQRPRSWAGRNVHTPPPGR